MKIDSSRFAYIIYSLFNSIPKNFSDFFKSTPLLLSASVFKVNFTYFVVTMDQLEFCHT